MIWNLHKLRALAAHASTWICLLLLAWLLMVPGAAHAGPDQAKGATPWAMVLCTYPDATVRPDWQRASFDALFAPGTQGLADYFRDVSYGAIDISGSRVFGWFTLPYLKAEALRVLTKDAIIGVGATTVMSPNAHFHASDLHKEIWIDNVLPPWTTIVRLVDGNDNLAVVSNPAIATTLGADVKIKRSRKALTDDCVYAAESQVDFSGFYGIIAMRNDNFDADSTGRRSLLLNGQFKTYGLVLLADWWLNTTHIAHEMLHGYGLQHSYGDPNSHCDPSGAYCDPWDIMSAMSVNSFSGALGMATDRTANSGPGMNAGMLDLMGWLPASRRAVWNGATTSLQLAPLSHPEWQGALAAVIPLESAAHYLTVELRAPDRWDRGFATLTSFGGRVFVHEVRIGTDGEPHTWLRSGLTVDGVADYALAAGGFYRDQVNNVLIQVASISTDASAAMITIQRLNPPAAPPGYSGGTGSLGACTTCPGSGPPKKPPRFQ